MKKILLSLFISSGFITGLFAQAPVTDFSGTPTTICAGQSVTWTNLTTGGTTYAWSFPGATNPISTVQAPAPRTYTASGTYTVTLIATNASGSDTMIKANYITVLPSPSTIVNPVSGSICTLGSITLTAYGGDSYVWSPATGLDNTTGSIVIATPAASTTYTVTGTNANGCTKNATVAVTVNTGPPPAPVSMNGPTTVCNGQTGVVFTVPNTNPAPTRTWTVPTGAAITAGLGTRSITVAFGATSGDVCCVASNVCGSSAPFCKTITVNPTPQVGTVGTITGPNSLCGVQTGITYSIDPVANAATYTWTTTGTATVTAGQGTTTVTVDFGVGNSSVCVLAGNDCNTSSQVCKTVSVATGIPAAPGAITGLTTICTGQSGVGYSVATVPTTSYYSWTVPSDASIITGLGTRSVSITFASSGTICVSDSNACGKSAPSCLAVTVDPNPTVGTIGTITGPTTICGNQSATYSIDPVSGASTYSWTIPGGATITAGQGTSTISVTYSVTGGNVCVRASNSCSQSAQRCMQVSLTNLPATPGTITGPATVCTGQTGVMYTVPNQGGGGITRTWTVPAGATITAGQGTRTITVTFSAGSSGSVCCAASNACGTSAPSCLTVTVDANQAVGVVGSIAGPVVLCAATSSVPYFIAPVTGASSYTWTVPNGATITTGQGTENISIKYAAASGSVCVTAGNGCGTSPKKCLPVAISASIAATPGTITGLANVCSEQVGTYSITPVPNATSYAWTVPTGATIISGQGTVSTEVAYGNTSGIICVSAGNACGASALSCNTIAVDPAVLTVSTTVTNTTDGSICNGSASAIAGGAAGPYMYAWAPSGVSTAVATGLCFGPHTVCVTSAGGCITCKSVYVASPSGIADLTDNGTIKIFPNPANDYIFIEGVLSSAANLHISVINMMGKRMMDESVFADKNFSQKINIQGIPSGVYFIEVRSGEMVRNSKVIKIH